MSLLKDRPVLRQFDKAGPRRAEMLLTSDTQIGEFAIRDGAGIPRAAAFVSIKGVPEFAVYGSGGNVRAYLATDDDTPSLVMKDRSAASRLVMSAYASGKIGMKPAQRARYRGLVETVNARRAEGAAARRPGV